jgi:hypothetical protein
MRVKLTEAEWLTMNTNFVAGHRYHTDCARSKYGGEQAANLEILKKRLAKEKQKQPT